MCYKIIWSFVLRLSSAYTIFHCVFFFTQSEPSSWRAKPWVRASGRACRGRQRAPHCTARRLTKRPAMWLRWPRGTWRGSASERRRRRRGRSGWGLVSRLWRSVRAGNRLRWRRLSSLLYWVVFALLRHVPFSPLPTTHALCVCPPISPRHALTPPCRSPFLCTCFLSLFPKAKALWGVPPRSCPHWGRQVCLLGAGCED